MAVYTNTSNKLIARESPKINGIHTDASHIQRFYEIQPELIQGMAMESFSQLQLYSNPYQEILGNNYQVDYIEEGHSDTWTWTQKVKMRPAYVVENLESTNTTPGIRKSPVKLKLSEDWFSRGEVLTPNRRDYLRVKIDDGAKYSESGGTVYICEYLDNGDGNKFFPARFLAAGTEWEGSFNLHGEGATLGSGVHFEGNIVLSDTLGDMQRFLASTTGYVNDLGSLTNKVMNFEVYQRDPITGKAIPGTLQGRTWMSMMEYRLMREAEMKMWNYLFYSPGDMRLQGEKNKLVRANMGYKPQVEQFGQRASFNTMSTKFLKEYLFDLFIGKMEPSQINVQLVGGFEFELMLDEAYKRDINGFMFDPKYAMRGDVMNAEIGYQAKVMRLTGGGTVTFRRINFPDTNILNGMRDVNTGKPSESANAYIFNLSGDLKNNLAIKARRGSLRYGWLNGTGGVGANSPFANGSVLSYLDDEQTFVLRDRKSPWLKDTSNTGFLEFRSLA